MAFFQTLIKSISARSKNVIKNILLSVGVKAVNVLCSLVLVPLSLGYLSKEEYGISCRKNSDLTAEINKIMAEMKADGSLQAIADKYELNLAD